MLQKGLGLEISTEARRLSPAERRQFAEQGYLRGLPVFAGAATPGLQSWFADLRGRLPAHIALNRVNNWHKCSASFFALCRTPAILDYVEDLIGPDFFQWGGQFFAKAPHDRAVVPWHQDAQYWPLSPRRTVTVWLALYDTDVENAAMRIIPGSHLGEPYRHTRADNPDYDLEEEAELRELDERRAVSMDLTAGQISLHDDGLLHGSGPNRSDRWRCGLTMRFSPIEVKADLAVWPNFEAYLARGEDRLALNPVGRVPSGESYPTKRFQHSAEFM